MPAGREVEAKLDREKERRDFLFKRKFRSTTPSPDPHSKARICGYMLRIQGGEYPAARTWRGAFRRARGREEGKKYVVDLATGRYMCGWGRIRKKQALKLRV